MNARLSEKIMVKAKHERTSPRPRSPRTPAPKLLPPTSPNSQRETVDDGAAYSVVDQIKRFRKPMTVAELAPILDVSEDVLYRMAREGKIPQLIIPGSRVTKFDPASIVFWLCKHNPLLNQVQKAS